MWLVNQRSVPPPAGGDGFVSGTWWLEGKIEQAIQRVIGEGLYRPDNEFLVNLAFAFPHSVDLAYRDTHRLGQLGQVPVATAVIAELKNPCLDEHGGTPMMTIGYIIAIYVPFVN